jgi:hypothetical protein
VFTRPALVRRLFALGEEELATAVRTLILQGVLVETGVRGWPGRWLVHRSALD